MAQGRGRILVLGHTKGGYRVFKMAPDHLLQGLEALSVHDGMRRRAQKTKGLVR